MWDGGRERGRELAGSLTGGDKRGREREPSVAAHGKADQVTESVAGRVT